MTVFAPHLSVQNICHFEANMKGVDAHTSISSWMPYYDSHISFKFVVEVMQLHTVMVVTVDLCQARH